MATIINTPSQTRDTGNGTGFLVGIILLALLVFFFLYYGLPALRSYTTVPQVNVPGKIDVNVNTPNNRGGK